MFLISGCVDFIFLLSKLFIFFSMDSLEQWRAAIGSFASCISFKNCKFQKREDGTLSHECMKCLSLIVYTKIIAMLLIVSVNVELNPGPTKKCPKCENSVANRVKIVIVVMFFSVNVNNLMCVLKMNEQEYP